MFGAGQQLRPSARNTLYVDVPGLSSVLKVRFPECRLPVCGRCKKNYKTRDMCRIQGEHTALPWSTVFICVTLDQSCTDSNNNLKKGNFTSRNIDWMPYCFKDDVDSKTLICAACKTKNYTRKQCRVKSRHRYLPWSTVYIVLSCEGNEETSGSYQHANVGNVPKDVESIKEAQGKRRNLPDDDDDVIYKRRAVGIDEPRNLKRSDAESDDEVENGKSRSQKQKPNESSDDIRRVEKSRTFLIMLDEGKCVLKWLDIDKSKAMPMQYYSSIPNQQGTMSHYTGQSTALSNMANNMANNIYTRPQGRIYQLPLENVHSNGQFFPLENQARQFMHQILPQQQGQFAHWQGTNSAAITHPVASTQFADGVTTEYSPSWYQKHIETQAQLQSQSSTRNWNGHPAQRFQVGQMMPSNMMPIQQGRAQISSRPHASFADFDHDSGQYNISEQHYMFVPTSRQDGGL